MLSGTPGSRRRVQRKSCRSAAPVCRLPEVNGADVVVDVAEQEIPALLPPERPLRWAERTAEAVGEMLDCLRRRQDLLQLGRQLLDARGPLREGRIDAGSHR